MTAPMTPASLIARHHRPPPQQQQPMSERHSLKTTHLTSVSALPYKTKKGKVFPYSLPSVGPGADPGVQAVSPQVT